jgi:hypothetical protein
VRSLASLQCQRAGRHVWQAKPKSQPGLLLRGFPLTPGPIGSTDSQSIPDVRRTGARGLLRSSPSARMTVPRNPCMRGPCFEADTSPEARFSSGCGPHRQPRCPSPGVETLPRAKGCGACSTWPTAQLPASTVVSSHHRWARPLGMWPPKSVSLRPRPQVNAGRASCHLPI